MLVVLVGAVTGCYRGVPAPDFSMPFDSVPHAAILAYLEKLEFDQRDGVGDEQPLVVGTCPGAPAGPVHRSRFTRNGGRSRTVGRVLGRPGRVIARMINRDTEGYPRYNLGPQDTVYWAVDQVEPVSHRLSRGGSLFISIKGLRGSGTRRWWCETTFRSRSTPASIGRSRLPAGYRTPPTFRWTAEWRREGGNDR